MGKLVPFCSSAVKRVTVKAEQGEECLQAEGLIREAAKLLASSSDHNSSIQWILEDCIDLLKNAAENKMAADPYTVNIAAGIASNQRLDPRHLLNQNSVLESAFRKRKKTE